MPRLKYDSDALPENVQRKITNLSANCNAFDIAYRLRLSPLQVMEFLEVSSKRKHAEENKK